MTFIPMRGGAPSSAISIYTTVKTVRIHLPAAVLKDIGMTSVNKFIHNLVGFDKDEGKLLLSKPQMRNPSTLMSGIRVLSKRNSTSQRFITLAASQFPPAVHEHLLDGSISKTTYPDWRIIQRDGLPSLELKLLKPKIVRQVAA